MSKIIAIWCGSIADVTRNANQLNIAHRLISVTPDPGMKHAFWACFCLDETQYERVTNVPRLTWK